MQAKLPSTRRLIFVWAVLIAATIGLMGAGRVNADIDLGSTWVTVLLVLAGAKSSLILWFYLNLRQSSSGWQKGFIAFLCVILSFILGAYYLTPAI
ncbi:cytochrome C oxidase subunit IV family protein [Magnetovibrio blakemorei]|uniref:cytochrome C oxidase subunit IV family protein n=1 Tax=Magnetovibrio blakemorei TaxID=28181 RepID=UPI0008599EEF|nr:cytochrome C oxidase subunit IV family protein [Magnetovibrio blakemorei]